MSERIRRRDGQPVPPGNGEPRPGDGAPPPGDPARTDEPSRASAPGPPDGSPAGSAPGPAEAGSAPGRGGGTPRKDVPLPEGDRRTSGAARYRGRSVPRKPSDLGRRDLVEVAKRTVREFRDDNLTDWAAALTYYAILSIFPGLLVLVSIIGLLSPSATDTIVTGVTRIAPRSVQQIFDDAVQGLRSNTQVAGAFAIAGLLAALWSASGYISAFMRASNAIYDVREGRPLWKTLPIRIGLTVVVGTLLAISGLAVVFTGQLARSLGNLIGVGDTVVRIWDIGKWPLLVVVLMIVLAILYWASPNVRQTGPRWVTPGGVLAVLIWLVASGAFAFYVASFASFNRTYGTLGGVIIFLIWLWISNLAILLGVEFDAELERGRAIAAGNPPDKEPFMRLRDDRADNRGQDKGLG